MYKINLKSVFFLIAFFLFSTSKLAFAAEQIPCSDSEKNVLAALCQLLNNSDAGTDESLVALFTEFAQIDDDFIKRFAHDVIAKAGDSLNRATLTDAMKAVLVERGLSFDELLATPQDVIAQFVQQAQIKPVYEVNLDAMHQFREKRDNLTLAIISAGLLVPAYYSGSVELWIRCACSFSALVFYHIGMSHEDNNRYFYLSLAALFVAGIMYPEQFIDDFSKRTI